jgi:spore germination protein YaaH
VEAEKNQYVTVANALNRDFRTVLHATATEVGIAVAPKIALDYYRLIANIETSRALAGQHMTVMLTDSGIICIR